MNNRFYGLPGSFILHPSRRFFYLLNWEPKTRSEAADICSTHYWTPPTIGEINLDRPPKDWGSLPIPLSQEENGQIAALMGGLNIWLGIEPSTSPGYQNYWRPDLDAWGVSRRFRSKLELLKNKSNY